MLKLTYSNIEFQNFPGEDPQIPLFKEREGRRGESKGKEGREGREGTGEGRRGGMGVLGRGGALNMGSAPHRDKLWIRPWLNL